MSAIAAPALIEGLDEDIYHADPITGGSLSYSGMKELLKSAAHYRHYIDKPRVTKKAFDEGHVIHALVLGADLGVVELDVTDYRTKDAREARDDVYASGLIPLKAGELDPMREVAEAVLAYGPARDLFEADGPVEVSMFAPDPKSGVIVRGRTDKISDLVGETVLVDLKTCQDASPTGFRKDIAKFQYYLQATVYTTLWHQLHPDEPIPEMRFVAVSKTQPHLVSVNRVGWEYEDLGQTQMRRAIDRYAECVETGEWPGYLPIVWEQSPPRWLLAEEGEEEMEIIL